MKPRADVHRLPSLLAWVALASLFACTRHATITPVPDAGAQSDAGPCGALNEQCCDGGTCATAGTACEQGLSGPVCVVPCGEVGDACCAPDNSCFAASSVCSSVGCVACGGDGEPCCPVLQCAGAASACFPAEPLWTCLPFDVTDPALRPGFPKQLTAGWPVLTVAKVNAQPGLSILLATVDGRVQAIKSDGSSPAGWPISFSGGSSQSGLVFSAGHFVSYPAGSSVIGSSPRSGLVGTDGSGAALPGWPRKQDDYDIPTLGDIDGDGADEVFACGTVTLYGYHSGTTAPGPCGGWVHGFPIYIAPGMLPVGELGGGAASSHVTLGDLDGDGRPEVVTLAGTIECNQFGYLFCRALFAFHADGTPVPGLNPVIVPGDPGSGGGASQWVAIGDVDGDGQPELVVPAGLDLTAFPDRMPRLPVVSNTGVIKFLIPIPGFSGESGITTAPVLADIDGDGVPEIIVQGDDSLHVFTIKGGVVSELPGFPVHFIGPQNGAVAFTQGNSIPVVGDLDGDGSPEIVINVEVAGTLWGELRAYRSDGTMLDGFPKHLPIGAGSVPAIADLDGDGTNQLIFTTFLEGASPDLLFVYDLSQGAPTAPAEWGQFGNGAGHTFSYRSADAGPGELDGGGPTSCNDVDAGACTPACENGEMCMSASTSFPTCRACGGLGESCCGDCSCAGGAACVLMGSSSLAAPSPQGYSCCYPCGCHDNGQSCSTGADCCSGTCAGGICQCGPTGTKIPATLVVDGRDPCCNGSGTANTTSLCEASCN